MANDTAIYASGLIAGRKVLMLLDTGSSVTLVHKKLLGKLSKNIVIEKFSEPIVSANGELLDIVGKCRLRICLGGIDVVHSVLVAADITQECLLGVDFLAANKFKINFEDRTLEVNGKATALSGRSGAPVVFRVSLAETRR